jgi:hypothetical protein
MSFNLPGFSADRSLTGSQANFRPIVHAATTFELGVRPAQLDQPCRTSTTSAACLACWADCIAGCDPPSDCFPLCRAECGGQPAGPAPIPCTPQDNSVNRTICTLGIDAWQTAAAAICNTTLGPIPIFGGPLAAACVAGTVTLATQMKNDCPPAVICV